VAQNDTSNVVKARRSELQLSQQEAARRADVSLATWRRFESAADDPDCLDGFRPDNVKGFAKALRQTVQELHTALSGSAPDELDRGVAEQVRLFNESFTGEPLSPADAMTLFNTVDLSDFHITEDGHYHCESELGGEFNSYLKGEATIRDVQFLRDLPEFVLTQVNNHWLVRMGERIIRIGKELVAGRVPVPVCLADEFALTMVVMNSTAPQLSEFDEIFPDLLGPVDVFGDDPDFSDPEDDEGQFDWMDRVLGGLLPPSDGPDLRRHDIDRMDFYGQGVYDPADPRHPLRWFDRDDLRDRFERELQYPRLSEDERAKVDATSEERARAVLNGMFGSRP
jgi:transcriptional regulator with XRE-family HTH domain